MKSDWDVDAINLRLAKYLPTLSDPAKREQFFSEFFDMALKKARRIYYARDPNRVYKLDDGDLSEAVDKAFRKIFREVVSGKLDRLTWAYLTETRDARTGRKTGAIYEQLTLIMNKIKRRRKRNARNFGPNEAEAVPSRDHPLTDTNDLVRTMLENADLTEQEKDILRLKVLEGMTWEETADAMGITVGRARVIFSKAMEKLRRWLEAELGLDQVPGDRPPPPQDAA